MEVKVGFWQNTVEILSMGPLPELVMMAPHSNVCDDRPYINDSLDGLISAGATNEASTENPVLVQGIQVG